MVVETFDEAVNGIVFSVTNNFLNGVVGNVFVIKEVVDAFLSNGFKFCVKDKGGFLLDKVEG